MARATNGRKLIVSGRAPCAGILVVVAWDFHAMLEMTCFVPTPNISRAARIKALDSAGAFERGALKRDISITRGPPLRRCALLRKATPLGHAATSFRSVPGVASIALCGGNGCCACSQRATVATIAFGGSVLHGPRICST